MTQRHAGSALVPTALVAALLPGAVAAASEAEREKAAENFVQADVDADGALTLAEFTTLIDLNAEDDLGRAATVKRFGGYAKAFGRIDSDGDGVVTPAEIRAQAER